jgi:hypothetical protein
MKKSLSKKAKKVIEESLEEFKAMPPCWQIGDVRLSQNTKIYFNSYCIYD